MVILCMVPVYKRPELLKLTIDCLEGVQCDYAKVIPFFILSREDKCFEINKNLVKKYRYLVYKNNPLGEKKNAGLREALKLKWDYYMDLGSDNVFTSLLWAYYKPFFEQKTLFFGLINIFFYEILTEKAIFVANYAYDHENKSFAYGAGRIIHRSILETVKDPWRSYFNSGMDGISRQNIIDAGFKEDVVDTKGDPVMLDIKGSVSINPFSVVENMKHYDVDVEWIRDQFGIETQSPRVDLLTLDGFHKAVIKNASNIGYIKSFNEVNQLYRSTFGKERFKSYNSYANSVKYNYNQKK